MSERENPNHADQQARMWRRLGKWIRSANSTGSKY